MSKKAQQLSTSSPLILFLLMATLFHLSHGDIGTAARYSPPYLPCACYGNDGSEFPPNRFAVAGDGIWDSGAACGREYLVRCISGNGPGACKPDQIIKIKIVDYVGSMVSTPSRRDATIILCDAAFARIANPSAASVNIEYKQA